MIHVVAGVIYDADDRVLIAQRLPGKHLAGGWEFPGGKLEPGETPQDGLSRELAEELGIEISTPRPLLRLMHCYPYGEVLLDVWVIRRYSGQPRSLDGQALRWCHQTELEATTLLPADGPVVAALRLPQRLTRQADDHYELQPANRLVAPCRAAHHGPPARLLGALCATLEEARMAVSAGVSFLVLVPQTADETVRVLCQSVPLPVFIRAPTLEQAWALGASGLNALSEATR